jgi:hypothetical protein
MKPATECHNHSAEYGDVTPTLAGRNFRVALMDEVGQNGCDDADRTNGQRGWKLPV